MKTMKVFFCFLLIALSASAITHSSVVEYYFTVTDFNLTRLCKTQRVTGINGMVPGPVIEARENDTVMVHVFNSSPHNVTLHWHGVYQRSTQWADGPEYITQCPIQEGKSYTYKYTVTGQEGTLWWHSHSALLRAYVHGAIIIRPRLPSSYPFPEPHREIPIVLGEWWGSHDLNQVFMDIQATGGAIPLSTAHTINGMAGDQHGCADDSMFQLSVEQGKTYLLRIVNANLISQMFLKVANHVFTVVAIDAGYTTPYNTELLVIAPGQTVDALLKADQREGSYYMAASAYVSASGLAFDNSTARAVVVYDAPQEANHHPVMPRMPAFNDTASAHTFYTNLTGLEGGPHWLDCPTHVDEDMFITFGLNLEHCPENSTCVGPIGQKLSASMNNVSFVVPRKSGSSMLEAFYKSKAGVYSRDFPNNPPQLFDFVGINTTLDLSSRIFAPKGTKVKTLKFGSVVHIVLQNVVFLGKENHPIHLHGFDMYVLAQGFGVFNSTLHVINFNLKNPQRRNTVAVPAGGWAVVRFKADNPGIWYVHCHIEDHLPWGLAMAFEVQNGPTPATSVPPPPPDLPLC